MVSSEYIRDHSKTQIIITCPTCMTFNLTWERKIDRLKFNRLCMMQLLIGMHLLFSQGKRKDFFFLIFYVIFKISHVAQYILVSYLCLEVFVPPTPQTLYSPFSSPPVTTSLFSLSVILLILCYIQQFVVVFRIHISGTEGKEST